MKKIIAPAVVALAVGFAPALGLAQEAFDYGTWDANDDGILSQDEYGAIGDSFGEYDANGDGFVNEEEYAGFADAGWGEENEQTAGLFNEWDDNEDNQLSEDEWGDEEEFAGWDENQSAALESEEEEGWF